MNIQFNGETTDIAATTLADALTELGFAGARIATAVNGDFVPAALRPTRELTAGDRIEIVAPMQGG
jgi:sulfur carrier protein